MTINLNNLDKIWLYELADYYWWKYKDWTCIRYKYGFIDCWDGIFSIKNNNETLAFVKKFKFDYWFWRDGNLFFNKFKQIWLE